MGGAGVATADDTSAVYWNPAAVGVRPGVGGDLDVGAGYEISPGTMDEIQELVDDIDRLEQEFGNITQIQDSLNQGTSTHPDDLVAVLRLILVELVDLQRADRGMFVGSDVSLHANVSKMSFGASFLAYGDLGIEGDLEDLALANIGTDAQQYVDNALQGTDWDQLGVTSGLYPAGSFEEGLALELAGILEGGGIVDPLDRELMSEALIYFAGPENPTDPYYPYFKQDPATGTPGLFPDHKFAESDLRDPKVQHVLKKIVAATVGGHELFTENDTGLYVRGAFVQEYSFAKSFPLVWERLFIGAAAKVLVGSTLHGRVDYYDETTGDHVSSLDEAMDKLQQDIDANGREETTQVGLDVGVLFRPNRFVRLALVGKNVNGPEFDLGNSSNTFALDPQWRAGVAVTPLPWLCVALDMDFTENRSQIAEDYGTRMFSLGAEFIVAKVVALRAGMYGNLLMDEVDPVYTAGIGVGIGRAFTLDVAAYLGGDIDALTSIASGDYTEASNVPESAGVSVSMQLNIRF
jgi:hypothetical protein